MAGQAWYKNEAGGYFANPQLSQELRYAAYPLMKMRQFTRVIAGFGRQKGDTVDFNRISRIATAGGELTEDQPIPASKFTVSRGQLTVTEYGNSIEWTGKLEDLSQFGVQEIVVRVLRDDMAAVMDKVVADELKKSVVIYTPTATNAGTFVTNGSPTLDANSPLNVFHVKEIVDYLKATLWAEPYDGNDFICVAHTTALRGIKDDSDWEEAVKFGDPERLFSGEVGRIYGCRFVETTNPDALASSVGTNGAKCASIFLGHDPIIEAVVVPEEIRVKVAEDYGRSRGVAWYFLGGFALSWNSGNAGEGRIVWVTDRSKD